MRTSFVSRTVIAVATLSIGSVALAAAPANAAAANGVTRDQILAAAAGVRAAPAGSVLVNSYFGPSSPGFGPATNRILRSMVNKVCITDPDGPETPVYSIAATPTPGSSADGLTVTAVIINTESSTGSTPQGRLCTFGAVAPVAGSSVLNGTATVTGGPAVKLSGDAVVTPPVNSPIVSSGTPTFPTFSATGNAVQTVKTKVADKKTSKEKKAAKKAYAKRLKAVKKAYAKALKKAASSKSKKAAAKKAYKAKRSSAKAKYRYAVANYKIKTSKVATPFSISAQATTPSL